MGKVCTHKAGTQQIFSTTVSRLVYVSFAVLFTGRWVFMFTIEMYGSTVSFEPILALGSVIHACNVSLCL